MDFEYSDVCRTSLSKSEQKQLQEIVSLLKCRNERNEEPSPASSCGKGVILLLSLNADLSLIRLKIIHVGSSLLVLDAFNCKRVNRLKP